MHVPRRHSCGAKPKTDENGVQVPIEGTTTSSRCRVLLQARWLQDERRPSRDCRQGRACGAVVDSATRSSTQRRPSTIMPGRLQNLLCCPCLVCYHCSEDIDDSDAAKTDLKRIAEANAAWNAQPAAVDLQDPVTNPRSARRETKSVSISIL